MSLVILNDGYISLEKSGDKHLLVVGNYEEDEETRILITKDNATEMIELLREI